MVNISIICELANLCKIYGLEFESEELIYLFEEETKDPTYSFTKEIAFSEQHVSLLEFA